MNLTILLVLNGPVQVVFFRSVKHSDLTTSVFVQWMVGNAETYKWSKCREKVSLGCLVTNGTYISHCLPGTRDQGPAQISERTEILQEPEVKEDHGKRALPAHGSPVALMNSQKP